jgi:hypothetical protein
MTEYYFKLTSHRVDYSKPRENYNFLITNQPFSEDELENWTDDVVGYASLKVPAGANVVYCPFQIF